MAYQIPLSTHQSLNVADLGESDDLFVARNVIIVSTGDFTVDGRGTHDLTIDGIVANLSNRSAIVLGADSIQDSGNTVAIGASGEVRAFGTGPAISIFGHSTTITNAGLIHAVGDDAIRMLGNNAAGQSSIVNTGSIISDVDTALSRGDSTETMIIDNRGLLRGADAFDSRGDGVDKFTNSGRVIGTVILGAGDDVYVGQNGRLSGAILGGSGNDRITTGIDNDVIDGGIGIDTMKGGMGNDRYFVTDAKDIVVELAGQGADAIQTITSLRLPNHVEHLELSQDGGFISGTGNALANKITGNVHGNSLSGLAGSDTIDGGDGDDVINGGIGSDTLTGGDDTDSFVFDTALVPANRDTLIDFDGFEDTIRLDNAVFKAIGAVGVLKASAFKLGAKATDGDDRIIYNKATGGLFYDADGSGAAKAVLFTTLLNKAAISAADFQVI